MMNCNMVKKFDDYIREGFLSKTYDRYRTGEVRKEDGRKVKTSIGVDIVIKDSSCDYEWFIKEILRGVNGNVDFFVRFDSTKNFNADEMKNIRNNTAPYDYLVCDNVVAGYPGYEELIENSVTDEDELSEDDYISIIRGISKRLSEVELINGGYELDGKVILYLEVIDKDYYEDWLSKNSNDDMDYFEETMFDKFISEIRNKYSNRVRVFMDEGYPVMRINYDSLSNYDEIRNYALEYFKL